MKKPTDSELRKCVSSLEVKFARAGKRVVVVNLDDLLDFVRKKGMGPTLVDQTGNGNDLFEFPRHY